MKRDSVFHWLHSAVERRPFQRFFLSPVPHGVNPYSEMRHLEWAKCILWTMNKGQLLANTKRRERQDTGKLPLQSANEWRRERSRRSKRERFVV